MLVFAVAFIVQMFTQPTTVSVVMGLIGVGVIGIFIWLGWAFAMDVRDARGRGAAPPLPLSPPFYSQWPGETVPRMHAGWAQLVEPEHRAAFVAMLAQQHAAGQSPPRQRSAPQPPTRPRPTSQLPGMGVSCGSRAVTSTPAGDDAARNAGPTRAAGPAECGARRRLCPRVAYMTVQYGRDGAVHGNEVFASGGISGKKRTAGLL
ncbi:MAG: hypothetical protein ABT15_33640 [Pseudonocardia sp. SCN 73-27]|uniref:hypothetical protein n=1 Tax=Pseudonocardia sp. TaxID=60912 RepID=UPI00086AF18B|nr:hypothetical protein [Pseudonocardia sp.]ODU02893.1 MAG: hypothetical protein ABS80_27185 [Pseudonocardia sp. SCN 72-51]ODU98206.1 MAG: hypothetical protein ABT15_33640 [Pseudonocardia sp. SCN 73-27]